MDIGALSENKTLITILIAVIGAASLLAFWFFWTRKPRATKLLANRGLFKRDTTPEHEEELRDGEDLSIDQFVSVDARVYDNLTRTIYNATIPAENVREIRREFGNLGRKWFREGKWLYAFSKSEAGKYTPVDRLIPETMDEPPSKLHRALMQQEVEVFFDVQVEKNFFQKYGAILWFVGVCIFIMFLMVMDRMS